MGNRAQGQHIARATCAACHGADGNSTNRLYPKLAGQKPSYLYRQLSAFRQGTRKSAVMSGIVSTLADADMANVASFYGKQLRKPDAVQDSRLAALGERVFYSGMPSCAMCHASGGPSGMMGRMPMMGMMGSGMMANVPNLEGQHAAYIVKQLDDFADGERQGMMMNQVAATLNETDRKAVAEFLSSAP